MALRFGLFLCDVGRLNMLVSRVRICYLLRRFLRLPRPRLLAFGLPAICRHSGGGSVSLRLCRLVIVIVLFIAILEPLIQYTDSLNAIASLFLRFEFEAHLDLLVLLALVSELVRYARVLIIRA